jgi:hypothetical protein
MEHKNNYGPHLIIVPNAVMVNWKSELTQWLPSVRCVYYVGHKEERARKFQTEVSSLQFNVLVTTYEYIMRDRTRLCKVRRIRLCSHRSILTTRPAVSFRELQASCHADVDRHLLLKFCRRSARPRPVLLGWQAWFMLVNRPVVLAVLLLVLVFR